MLSALRQAQEDDARQALGRPSTSKSKRKSGMRRTRKSRLKVDVREGTAAYEALPAGYVRLKPGELDDDIKHLFDGLPPAAPAPVGINPWNADGSFAQPECVRVLAEQIKADMKAASREAAAETRRINKAKKALDPSAPKKPKRTRTPTVLTGRAIPQTFRGRVTVTGEINASTGKALVISLDFRGKTAQNLVVWAGAWQEPVLAAAKNGKAISVIVNHPANENFKPSIARVCE